MSSTTPPRLAATLLLVGTGVTDLTFRLSQVAVPLVVFATSGSAASTGLAAGATGLPVLTSPWWARRARQWVRDGRALALCYLAEAAALGLVPAATAAHRLSWPVLLGSGLALGSVEALSGPGRDALLADLGDRIGVDRALGLLTLRDFVRRGSMVAGPAVAGVVVGHGDGLALLWLEVAAVLAAALLALGVRAPRTPSVDEPPRIWTVVRRDPRVLAGWVARGTGCSLWFGFSLGLALLGVQQGRGGTFLAVAMTGYGVGSLVGTALTLPLLSRVPVLPAVVSAWITTGTAWLVMGLVPSLLVIAVASAVSGCCVVVGNAGVTAQITRASRGPERRTLLAGQSVVVNACSSTGLLAGGPILAALGPRATLVATGTLTAVVVLVAPAVVRRRLTSYDGERTVSRGREPSSPGP